MSMPPITIAGAGSAGLTLGRCLSQKGIPTIELWHHTTLLGVPTYAQNSADGRIKLPRAVWTLLPVHSAGGRREQFLREEQDIRWEHTIKDIEATSQKVIVRIHNEQAVESHILIGTDGVHSQVRKSLAPDIQLKVLPFVVYNGQRKMSPDSFQNIMAPQMRGLTIIQCRQEDVVFQIAVNQYTATYVDLSYTYSRPARQNDPLHRPDRAVPGATHIPEEFYAELQELRDLGQAYEEMFDASKVRKDRVLHWLMRSTLGAEQEIRELADRGVLLVGDAIHAVPILGGEGGNNAMKDGVDLAEHIAAHGPQGVKSFSSARYDGWKKGVEESEQRLVDMHSPAKASL